MSNEKENKSTVNRLIDLFFPDRYSCKACDSEIVEGAEFCEECKEEVKPITGKTCVVCGTAISGEGDVCFGCKNRRYNFERNFAVFPYTDAISRMILKYKDQNARYLTEFFVSAMREKYENSGVAVDLISYVPSDKNKAVMRGIDCARELAFELSKRVKVPLFEGVERTKEVIPQKRLKLKERTKNVKGVFALTDKKDVKGKTILLIDDKITTGATLSELARQFKKAGAKHVFCLTLSVSDEYDVKRSKTIDEL